MGLVKEGLKQCIKLDPFPDTVPSAKNIKGDNISAFLKSRGWRNKHVM